jgi:hypothetical protein
MVSPALRKPVRSIPEAIRDLETKLSGVHDPAGRQLIECALSALRDALARQG